MARPAPPAAAMPEVKPQATNTLSRSIALPHDRLAVGRHRDRAVDELLEAELAKRRDALGGGERDLLEALHAGARSSCAKSNGTPFGWNEGVPISQPPTAKPPTSGLR